MIFRGMTYILMAIIFCQCQPSSESPKESVVRDPELEKYLEETFFYYELMRNQPSILRDSIFLIVAQDLRVKYNLDTARINHLTKNMGTSDMTYSQMLDSIKARLKNASMK